MSEEQKKGKSSIKLFRIICLCLIVVVTGAVIGTYFLTKKTNKQSYQKYISIVEHTNNQYGKDSLFDEKGNISILYHNSVALSSLIDVKNYSEEERNNAQELANDGDYSLLDKIKATDNVKLLKDQYLNLLKYSHSFYSKYAKELSQIKGSDTRANMNEVFASLESLEKQIENFEKEKTTLEQATSVYSELDPSKNNLPLLLKDYMVSFVGLINQFINLNLNFAQVCLTVKNFNTSLNENNVELVLNFAVLYGASCFVVSKLNTISNTNDLCNNLTTNNLFVLTKTLYSNLSKNYTINNNAATFNYLYNRTFAVFAELDGLRECAANIKSGTQNSAYQNIMQASIQNAVSYIYGVNNIITFA